jgi:L-amino acid N-acyltransferase YncA
VIIRHATPVDAPAMADLLNEIIAIGGTTAHEHPMVPDEVCRNYIDGQDVATSVLAEEAGQLIGWQSVGLWKDQMHIGTFVRAGLQAKGVGAALFATTCEGARAKGLTEIIAHIRADNVPGLAYYARIGFVDDGAEPGFALRDGRVVGRVHRRFALV